MTRGFKHHRNRIIGIAFIGVIAIVIIILLVHLFGSSNYETIVDRAIRASASGDGKAVFMLAPKDVQKAKIQTISKWRYDTDDVYSIYADPASFAKKAVDSHLGNGWTYTYRIINTEDLSKSDIKDIEDSYNVLDMNL